MAVNKLAREDFKREVEGAGARVVVDFYADWCGRCRQVAPALGKLSSKWEGEVRFVNVNIDECPQLATRYMILSNPTIMPFENGAAGGPNDRIPSSNLIERDLGLDRVSTHHGDGGHTHGV